jgi:DNA-binding transcriptional LysR family regulator
MDLNFLKTFVTVVDRGSMAAASRVLNLSPSAIAQQLHTLERELGLPLIVRVGRTARMSEHGGRILQPVRQLLSDAANLHSLVNDDEMSGELKLGACTTPLVGILPKLLARVSALYPNIKVHIQSGSSEQLYTQVEANALDAAFVLKAPHDLPKTCEWMLLREEALVVLAPKSMADRDPLALLREEPFIRYDRLLWGGRSADNYLRTTGIATQDRFELNTLNAIAVMVDSGLGVSLVPDWISPEPAGINVVRLALPDKPIGRRIGIVWSRASIRMRLLRILLDESAAIMKQ